MKQQRFDMIVLKKRRFLQLIFSVEGVIGTMDSDAKHYHNPAGVEIWSFESQAIMSS